MYHMGYSHMFQALEVFSNCVCDYKPHPTFTAEGGISGGMVQLLRILTLGPRPTILLALISAQRLQKKPLT